MEDNKPEETFAIGDILKTEEAHALFKYLNTHGAGPNTTPTRVRNCILDWLATQPAVLERMNKLGVLITYFAYALEATLYKVHHEDEAKK